MKIKTYCLILAIAAGFFCAAASDRIEPPLSGEKPLLIDPPHPAFVGIDKLHIVILRFGLRKEKDETFIKQLEADVKEKLRLAGIELDTKPAENILIIPELRIYINSLSLQDSQQCVFRVRTALARAVCLKDKQNPVFKADLWQTLPAMQASAEQEMPDKVTNLVMEQVDAFISIYKATRITGIKSSDTGTSENAISENPAEQVEKDVNPAALEYNYVASESSNIFHKPDCRWAQNISKENLVKYKSREEAIQAGKRPCKTCNP